MNSESVEKFKKYINTWFEMYGRHELPWRLTTDPYAILVSELMLQQTQVSRVIPKYLAFVERFPNLESLRSTQLVEMLRLWQGLGYNRRAKYLWQLAQQVDQLPSDEAQLRQLPGIGPYTAAAICSFAYNQPVIMIETNIRSVFLYHFFANQTGVRDAQLLPLIVETIDQHNPRQWYWALMDYGSHLKSILPNPSRQSRHHTQQSKFAGSVRQVRGEIIRLLTYYPHLSLQQLNEKNTANPEHFSTALEQLIKESIVTQTTSGYSIT